MGKPQKRQVNSNASVNEIMHRLTGQLASQPDAKWQDDPAGDADAPISPSLSYHDLKAYLSIDPVLSELYKQYLEARSTAKRIIGQFGANEPMSQTAQDSLESCQSALETRLIELRNDATLSFLTAQITEQRAQEKNVQASQRSTNITQENARSAARKQKIREQAQKAGEDSLFMVFLMLWLINNMLRRARRELHIASAFTLASTAEEVREQSAA